MGFRSSSKPPKLQKGAYRESVFFPAAKERLVRGHLSIRLNAMLEAEELPAGVADLDSALDEDMGMFNSMEVSLLHFRTHVPEFTQ